MPRFRTRDPSSRSPRTCTDVALSRYIREANAIPELSRDEERALARSWTEKGDSAALAKLVQANVRHVVPMAISFRHYGLPFGDLVAEGNFGLVSAARRFDPSRETRFVKL